jgi:acetyltransferase EpsM
MGSRVYVIGAGGHAKVVISTLWEAGYAVKGALDDDAAKWGKKILHVPISGPIAAFQQQLQGQPAIMAIGDNLHRKQLLMELTAVSWISVIHPRAYVHPSVELGEGTVIFAGAVVQPEVVIGKHVIINTSASVDHDCNLGDFVHVCPGSRLGGGVTLAEGVLLGTGGVVIPDRKVGAWATIGAGSVVLKDIPAHATGVGVPARIIKTDASV